MWAGEVSSQRRTLSSTIVWKASAACVARMNVARPLIGFPGTVASSACSIRGDTSRPPARPPAETGNLLLPIAIHDHAYAAIAMLLSLPGMDPNQLMDDKGNTWLLAAISDKDLDLASCGPHQFHHA